MGGVSWLDPQRLGVAGPCRLESLEPLERLGVQRLALEPLGT